MGAPQEEQYNFSVRIIEGKETNRVPLQEILATGLSEENAKLLKNMYSVVLEKKGAIILLIPTAEVKSPEEQNLQLLERQKERVDQQIQETRAKIKQAREQQSEVAQRQETEGEVKEPKKQRQMNPTLFKK